MIELHDVAKAYGFGRRRQVVYEGLSVVFDGRADVGILGTNGSGKSTLLRMIAGMEQPDSGRILRRGRVSFPVGYSGAFHPNLTARENVRFVSRLFGADQDQTIRFVREFCEIGKAFEAPLYTYSNNMRARVTFATSLAIEFDIYLIDEMTAVGDVGFKRKCLAALAERRRHARIIMVSQSTHTLSRLCEVGAILEGGQIFVFRSMEEAVTTYQTSISVTDA